MLEGAPTRLDAATLRWSRLPSRRTGLAVMAALVLLDLGNEAFRSTAFPPRELFVGETDIAHVTNRSDVVQPLVGANDTFDIAVTVWQLATMDERSTRDRLLDKKVDLVSALLGGDAAYASWYEAVSVYEKTIFSDIVFRGVRLSDTNLHANVTFQIPTDIFHMYSGPNDALRASFVILPHSPSPLDHFKDFTTWFPDPPGLRFKSLPFPLNSPTIFSRRPVDNALDSFALTIPLLERHEVPWICPSQKNDSVDGIVDSQDWHHLVLQTHPHVITRTHLRVVRESRLFRRDAYLRMHKQLRDISCGRVFPQLQGSRTRFCRKSYAANVNWESMVRLAVPEVEGGFREESAYAPYMDVFWNAAERKDVVPFPNNRDPCRVFGTVTPNRTFSDHMNVTWHLSYSGVTPWMFLLGDMKFTPKPRHYNDSEFVRAKERNVAQMHGGLHGYRYREDSHPRRRILVLVSTTLISVFVLLLNCIYWGSRTSTAFISVPGTFSTAAGELLVLGALLPSLFDNGRSSDLAEGRVVVGVIYILGYSDALLPLVMLRAVSPVQLFMNGKLAFPRLRWVRATHQERATARLDARTDWRWKFAIFFGILLINRALGLRRRFLITPVIPAYKAEERPDLSMTFIGLVDDFPIRFKHSNPTSRHG
ncbi:hypothetical protein DFH09DRAFT_1215840 [Mycena vulgaris]|nr:hypothetical protein DFH09DRAFT_1215840 [Mycena vulgaris]